MNDFSFDHIQTASSGKDIYLWGARLMGAGMLAALRRCGIKPSAFLDSSPDIQGRSVEGLQVLPPTEILAQPRGTFFIIICTAYFNDQVSAVCREAGLLEMEDFADGSKLQKLTYNVDIVGMCNLHCLGCPQGAWPNKRSMGFMELETYGRVLDKILEEDPFVGMIYLYKWGEPLLHPKLPEIIRMTNERGLVTAISSNLNHGTNLEEVIKARPGIFRISASGCGKNYEKTHSGGKWSRLLENMRRLSELRARYHPEMPIEVNFHLYKDRQDDYQEMNALCEELGFIFRAGLGFISPSENVELLMRGEPLNDAAREIVELQAFPLEKTWQVMKEQNELPCNRFDVIEIAWDGSVIWCPDRYDPAIPLLAENFLDASMAELLEKRRISKFCNDCIRIGLHRWCNIFNDERFTVDFKAAAGIAT